MSLRVLRCSFSSGTGTPIALLSPAKSLNLKSCFSAVPLTTAPFQTETETLLRACEALSQAQLAELMSLSDSLAALNHGRFHTFQNQAAIPAGFAFSGPAHKAFDAASLSPQQLAYADRSILTLSGLYGLLRPRDTIRPYRLEMGTKLATDRGKNLYEFWGDLIATELGERLSSSGSFLINVASNEYWKVVQRNLSSLKGAPVVTIKFPGAAVHAKQARGLFCRFLCEQSVSSEQQLTHFAEWSQNSGSTGKYSLVESGTSDVLTFKREKSV